MLSFLHAQVWSEHEFFSHEGLTGQALSRKKKQKTKNKKKIFYRKDERSDQKQLWWSVGYWVSTPNYGNEIQSWQARRRIQSTGFKVSEREQSNVYLVFITTFVVAFRNLIRTRKNVNCICYFISWIVYDNKKYNLLKISTYQPVNCICYLIYEQEWTYQPIKLIVTNRFSWCVDFHAAIVSYYKFLSFFFLRNLLIENYIYIFFFISLNSLFFVYDPSSKIILYLLFETYNYNCLAPLLS